MTIDGWWHTAADGAILIGQRIGSVDARAGTSGTLTVTLRPGAVVPAESGYGRFFAPTVSDDLLALTDAIVTPLSNPAADCPKQTVLPMKVFMDSLASCWTPGVDVTIAGWRDVLDGLCGCGPIGYFEKPKWLAAAYGVGWLFAEPSEINLGYYLTLYAPDEAALGADSGTRPTFMEVTGHFDDPAAATCRAVADPDADPEPAITKAEARRITAILRESCTNRFVATAVREMPAPASALSFCPPGDPLPVAALWSFGATSSLLDRVCYPDREIRLVGWFDPTADTEGLERTVSPAWLDEYGRPMLWSAQGATWDTGVGIHLFVDPATGLDLPVTAGWYVMTGHFDDPAAAACVRTDGANAGITWTDDCRDQFVVTGASPA